MISRYITLRDIMRPFRPDLFVEKSGDLGVAIAARKFNAIVTPLAQWPLNALENLSSEFNGLREACTEAGLPISARAVDNFIAAFSPTPPTVQTLEERARFLYEIMSEEMLTKMFFSIEADKQEFFTEVPETEVVKAFGSAEYDMREAARCIALDRWTASVFHSMRSLEFGLVALADVFNVPSDRTNWQQIIDHIEIAIKGISPNRGPQWRDDEKFYSDAALQFRFFKNAWRNHVMHGRDTYDEDRAIEVYRHMKSFMRHLSTKLSEPDVAVQADP